MLGGIGRSSTLPTKARQDGVLPPNLSTTARAIPWRTGLLKLRYIDRGTSQAGIWGLKEANPRKRLSLLMWNLDADGQA